MSTKVLAIVHNLSCGGLENRLMDILRNIDSTKVRIDIFTTDLESALFDEEVKTLGGKVYYNPKLTVRNMMWYSKYFKDFLITHPEYKIVHAHQDAWCSVFCKGAYMAAVPVRIAHSRTAIRATNLNYIAKNIIKLSTKKYANYYFAVSEKAGRWLFGDKLFKQGKIQIWPNAIDAKKYYYNIETRKKVRASNGWDGKYVVMHVGNFTKPKNHPFILKVFNMIHKKDKDALLILVGNGNRKELDSFIQENGLQEVVKFLGTRTDVNYLLQGADVFLFPSIFEGLPGAMVEAQASGLPCVLSDSISKEIIITPNLILMSVNEKPELWAEAVLSYKCFERKDTRRYIEDKGFDVCTLSKQLSDFYENSIKGEKENAGFI